MDVLMLSRLQFALTIMFHYLFNRCVEVAHWPCLTGTLEFPLRRPKLPRNFSGRYKRATNALIFTVKFVRDQAHPISIAAALLTALGLR